VACLTVRIEAMRAHCQANKQDKAAKRAFTTLLTRRRNLLQYLRRKDFEAYARTLAELRITGFS
jgi:small subunit ribosomal protein S15